MVNEKKIYTKKGDKGKTSLGSGQKVSKSSKRIQAYGTVDELNAVMGIVVELLKKENNLIYLEGKFIRLQNELFNLGAQLSFLPENRNANIPVITVKEIKQLENEIDQFNEELPPLKSFIIPGGGQISVYIHLARTVCRRAEREIMELAENEKIDGEELTYINRLSDWLFMAGRLVSKHLNIEELYWNK